MHQTKYTVATFDDREGDYVHSQDIGTCTIDDALATAAAIAQTERRSVQLIETMNDIETVAELNWHGVPVMIGDTEEEWRRSSDEWQPDVFDDGNEGDRDARLGR